MGDRDFLEELFAPVGRVELKRMFGGLGAFSNGLMFAIVIADVIYLKSDDTTRADFAAEGCEPFTYPRKDGRAVSLSYWRMPERLIDEPDEFVRWSRAAIMVARNADTAKGDKAKRRPKAAPKV
ncbi:MAG TPA: TfoX/Sxy family protein [Kaistia sp.]|nr:TfoX/Sxy family protein [Kaistia sp.]